jgi:hypothetical protein
MATRLEAVMADVQAEMVSRGVDVDHSWGKRDDERRKTVNWVSWVEVDDAETIEPPFATEYELDAVDATPATAGHAVYDRAIPVNITICGADPETSEAILDVFLAAAYQVLTISAFQPSKAPKRGERPTSRGHIRTLGVVFRIPVFSERLERSTTILTTTLDPYVVGMGEFLGDDFEAEDFDPVP